MPAALSIAACAATTQHLKKVCYSTNVLSMSFQAKTLSNFLAPVAATAAVVVLAPAAIAADLSVPAFDAQAAPVSELSALMTELAAQDPADPDAEWRGSGR